MVQKQEFYMPNANPTPTQPQIIIHKNVIFIIKKPSIYISKLTTNPNNKN